MAKAFEEAKEREIAGRYMGDMTAVELATEYHCHERTIQEIVHRLGMPNKRKWKLSQQSTPIVEDYQAGMVVGKTAFNTWVWIGRIAERILGQGLHPIYILRQTIKAHLCGNANAKDENVIRALKVRFRDKGTKKCPEFFRGVSVDVWLVFALAVTYIDQQKGAGPDLSVAGQPDVGPSK